MQQILRNAAELTANQSRAAIRCRAHGPDLNQVPIGTAVTNRTIGFGAQPLFPPGIDGCSGGPFFNLYEQDVANPCTEGFQAGSPNANKAVSFSFLVA